MILRRMDPLKPIMSGAIIGTLTQSKFYQLNLHQNIYVYHRTIEKYPTERDKEHRFGQFRRQS